MTMAELHSLYEQYFPSAPPQLQQGRASVTAIPMRYETPEEMVTRICREINPPCPICTFDFERKTTAKVYCSNACRQRAYRQRKKASK